MKFVTLIALSVMSLPVFAEQTCYVDMVDRYSRVVATYTGWDDPRVCQEGMKQCRKAIRLEPHLGGVDCIRIGSHGRPRPIPQPQPIPRPRPIPQPIPHGRIEVTPLIVDLANQILNVEKKTKIVEQLILQIGSPSLTPFINICSGTRTWNENANCLMNAVHRAPREMTSEDRAIRAVGASCTLTSTWNEEKACFEASLRGARLQALDYYAQSCSQMWNVESSARCFRQVFGVH